MDKSEMFGIDFEVDHRTKEERMQQKAAKKGGVASALGLGQKSPEAPMDTNYPDENEKTEPLLKINPDFGIHVDHPRTDTETFSRDELFEAVASGEVSKLDNLHQLLVNNRWKLSDSQYQSYGKTALMKALLHLKDGKNETVERLISISERMGDLKPFVDAAYSTNSYYEGQTALHIAIERRSLSYVQLLVSKGANIHAKACGLFFKPHDGPNFYFGELPLSLAACTNQPDIVDFLMSSQADTAKEDSHGNTVLHALVTVADNSADNTEFVTNMYDRILKNTAALHPELKLEDMENHKGLTPLKLAAKTGKIGIFAHILKREFTDSHSKHLSRKFTEWVYGPVHSSLYDLASVDSYEANSVMEILVYGSDIPNRHEMLQMEPLSRLLEEKWKMFAGRIFFLNFLVYLLYLIIFTVIAYNKKAGEPPFPFKHTTEDYLYVSGQIVVALANCYFLFIVIIDMKRKRPKLATLLIDGYYEILFFAQGLFFIAAAWLYLSGRSEYLSFLVLCLALSWVNILYFSRGDKHMGMYSVMIQKMILGDIMRFLVVYIVFLIGFSAAVVTLLVEPPVNNTTVSGKRGRIFAATDSKEKCVKPSFRSINFTILQLFKFTIGIGDLEFTQDHHSAEVFYMLLISYIILTYILLLNMLIALMNRTVEKTTTESTSIWKLQRAITILDMERRLFCCLKKRFRCGVEKNLSGDLGDDRRWCFRVEEVNWNKWYNNLGKINEDPGFCERAQQSDSNATSNKANRGRSWRGLRRQTGRSQHTEMNPLSSSEV